MSPPRRRTSSRAIASPRPVPPLSRSRASSRRAKRSKTRSRSASGRPPRRRRPRPRALARTPERDVHPGTGVSSGVVTRLPTTRSSSRRLIGTVPSATGPSTTVRRVRGGEARQHQRRQGGRLRVGQRLSPASSRARTRRSSTSAESRPSSAPRSALVLVGGAMPAGDVDLDPQRRQRAAQLVGDVGHEAALAVAGGREPFEHRVEGDRQGVDLVARLGHGESLVVAGARHPLGRRAQRLDRVAAQPRSPATRSGRGRAGAGGRSRAG